MSVLPSAELVASLAGYLIDRRDKRRITLAVLGIYLVAALYTLVGHSAGLPESKLVLESLEALAMVVVVAHVAGGVAQRAIAQRGVVHMAANAADEAETPAPIGRGEVLPERKPEGFRS